MAKKFKHVFFLVIAASFVFAAVAKAQLLDPNAPGNQPVQPSQVDKTSEGAINNNNDPNAYGSVYVNTSAALATTALDILEGDKTSGTPVSSLQGVGKMIGYLYTPQATSREYVADLIQDAGIVTPAYAQGLGFSSLAPVLETWKVFRTVAYFFYVIIFLVIGFMIMFRQKIGSQTVVTVQQALPKLLVSLIAVTFSYAIAGLMIEVMYLAMFLILNVFVAGPLGAINIANNDTNMRLSDFGSNSNIFSVAGIILNGNTLNTTSNTVGDMVVGALGITESTPGASVISSISGLAAVVVFAIALLFSIFKLFFELLKTYISIIIMIVTAPLALMLGALPGNNAFSNWIRGLFFHLAVFPTVLVVIVMAFLLQSSISANGGFLPPYIGGSGVSGSIAPILGLGVLLVIPDIVEKVKKLAPAGPFDEFAGKASKALSKGFSGGQLIDGLGFTDTRKLPFGGVSGENILRKGAIGVGAAAGGVNSFALSPRGSRFVNARAGAANTSSWLAKRLGDKELSPKKP